MLQSRYKKTSASKYQYAEQGYSLIELLIVLAILGLLVTLAAPRVMGLFDKAKSDTAKIEIETIGAALDLYRLHIGHYPGTDEGLTSLVEPPSNQEDWNGPYLKNSDGILDPWGRPYRYAFPGQHANYDLYTYGSDNTEGGDNDARDVTNW